MSDDLIDVRALIARYSNSEHIARADAYFSSMPDNPLVLRKPFFGLRDTPVNLYGAAEVLARLNLFPGAVVLDFGAGTGWLSKVLALIDCKPIAVDVSAAALAIGRRAMAADPVAADVSVDWRVFDGVRLPAGDASVDRIVSYDAFHHVADQAGTLREFYRVVRSGGSIVFHEPGPNHSKAPDSQFEMRHHDVIENDIALDDIWRMAEATGFSKLRVAPATPRTADLPLDAYNRVIAGRATAADTAAVMAQVVRGGDNLRIFSLDKGEPQRDSRHGTGLAGTFDVQLTHTGPDGLRGHARVTNTGRVRWRASINEAGGVFLGVKERDAGRKPDFGRVWLSSDGIEPGETVEVDFTLPAVAHPTDLVFDLVSEMVLWFETIGGSPLVIRVG